MIVELSCQALLREILPKIDPKRTGLTIDVGVGTCDFYFHFFEKLKFPTVAVEPLPIDEVRQLCNERSIKLIESCLSDVDGLVSLHVGNDQRDEENYNLNSMLSDWWGSSENIVKVPSLSLATLLNKVGAHKVTCLKIDVEGMEFAIIQQLQKLQQALLPRVLMFEYGGGGTRESGQGGWSKEILDQTMQSLKIIRQLGYQQAIFVDLAANTKARLLNLESSTLEAEAVFPTDNIYGNIIVLPEDVHYSESKIASICKPYEGSKVQESLLRKIIRRLR